MTEYLVLEKTKDGDWTEGHKYEAVSAKAAIKLALAGPNGSEGEFVAVPARSWQPVKVQVETALKFS